jgi:hypothetical protein
MNKRETRMYNPQHDRCVELQFFFCALQVSRAGAIYTAHNMPVITFSFKWVSFVMFLVRLVLFSAIVFLVF